MRSLFKSFCSGLLLICPYYLQAQVKNNLPYFIEAAQKNSPLLNDLNNQLQLNQIDSLRLRAGYGFIITANTDNSYSPGFRGWGYDKAITNGQNISAGVSATRALISRSNMKARLEAFRARAGQVKSQKELNIRLLNNQITDQFILTYSNQQSLDLYKEIVSLLENEDTILKKLTQSGVFKQTDYLAFKVTLQQNQLTLQQQHANWMANYALLKYLAGIADDDFSALELPVIKAVDTNVPFRESIYAASFVKDSLKLLNDALLIKLDYKPKLSIVSNAGYLSSLQMMPYKNWGLTVGFAISLPLYDGHQKPMLLRQNEIAQETRMKYQQHAERQYDQKTKELAEQIGRYENMMKLAQEQMEYAKTLVEANGKQLPTGDVKMADFILSLNNLLLLRSNLIQYETTLMELRNQLENIVLQ